MQSNHITTSRSEIARAVDAMQAEFDAAQLVTQNHLEPQHPGETYGDNFARCLIDTMIKQREVQ